MKRNQMLYTKHVYKKKHTESMETNLQYELPFFLKKIVLDLVLKSTAI